MKVTVGAIRQIVREEAERLNEAEEEVAAEDVDAGSLQKIRQTFMRISEELFKPIPTAKRTEALAYVLLVLDLFKDSRTRELLKTRVKSLGDIDKFMEMVESKNESYDRDKLRNLIMAEASQLVQG